MARALCEHCGFILKRCICDDLIPKYENAVHLLILRDKSETNHAKNTACLLPLVFSHTTIIDGDVETIEAELKNIDLDNAAILYPSENALILDETQSLELKVKTLVILDGSWKKAFKLYMSLQQLRVLPCISFKAVPQSRYRIRSTDLSYSLSSFEASVYAIKCLEKVQLAEHVSFFEKFIKKQIQLMPESLHKRYQGKP
ncbi:DTW domain-containing protein [Pseudoalteromonas xiamenensis]|uniref:tRNA-uridine aminocarboxypropyltransferase n=1 Tax=Pseudoalteromonas xiamenensis TaxID=882626 RepID=UPI0027E48E00|nr:tRNA-uridine aminocarboxypropyltransferase [Pseudoalteromonas xiamenensis]WMN60187.1 DTW domain-containing protein [Pseudoalteromonas xiamenensis]